MQAVTQRAGNRVGVVDQVIFNQLAVIEAQPLAVHGCIGQGGDVAGRQGDIVRCEAAQSIALELGSIKIDNAGLTDKQAILTSPADDTSGKVDVVTVLGIDAAAGSLDPAIIEPDVLRAPFNGEGGADRRTGRGRCDLDRGCAGIGIARDIDHISAGIGQLVAGLQGLGEAINNNIIVLGGQRGLQVGSVRAAGDGHRRIR